MEQWEQQPGEPTKWFTRFEAFRDLGTERTIEAAFRKTLAEMSAQVSTGKQKSAAARPSKTWYETSKTWDWVGRATAYDREQARLLAQAKAKAITEMMERHANAALLMYNKAILSLNLIDTTKQSLQPTVAMQMLKMATDIERLARGVSTSPKQPTEVPNANPSATTPATANHIDALSDTQRADLLQRLFRPRPTNRSSQPVEGDDGSGEGDHRSDIEGE